MKIQLLSAVALVVASTSLAHAQVTPDQLAAQYQAEGYTRIEVDYTRTRAEVEAIRDGIKLEIVYDLATGQVLRQETERVDRDDNTTPGVFVRHDDDDRYDDDRFDDDRYEDDHDDRHDDDDDHDDDRRGRDDDRHDRDDD